MNDVMQFWRNILFSVTATPLTQTELAWLAANQCAWVFINARLGRYYLDILGPWDKLQLLYDYLVATGHDPIGIATFKTEIIDGKLMMVLQGIPNSTEYFKVAPDVKTYDANGNLVSSVRPTQFVDVHSWAGWPEKAI
jgi:hypothetical protein